MADKKDLTGKDLAKNLSSSKKDAAEVAKSAKSIENSLVSAAKAIAGAFGKGGFVAGKMGGNNNGGNNGGGMPGPGDMQNNSLMRPGVGLTDFTNFASGMARGIGNFLPDVSSTIQRAGTYYNATIMGGYRGSKRISRGEVEDRTFGVLSSMGGVTSAGSSANVANIFSSQGMVASSDTYMQNTRAVGNAARYLNMSNEKAATAIGGLGTGASSANIMRNFGIYTTDPITGKERSMTQIFEDLAGRFTRPGANASAEDVQNSIRKGALGANIAASGLSADQQILFKQYMIDRASGNKMDLSNQSAMDNLMGKAGKIGNANPLNALMDLETSGEGAMKQATPSYIAGIEGATIALIGLDKVAGGLANVLGVVTAGLQTALGARTTQGLMTMANSSLNLISSGMEAVMSADPTGLSRAAAGGAAITTGTTGLQISGAVAAGGAVLGLVDKAVGGGDTSNTNPLAELNNMSFSLGGDEKVSIGQPIEGKLEVTKGFNETVTFGQQKGQPHSGIDYAATTSTKVYAVADGKVSNLVKDNRGSKTGNGNFVELDHGIGKNKLTLYSLYKHLSKVNPALKKDMEVKKGTWLGNAGSTGDSSGVHVHYQVKEGNTDVDPKLLGAKLGNKKSTKVTMSISDATTSQMNAVMRLLGGDLSALSSLSSGTIGDLTAKYGVSSGSSSPANKYANAGDTGSSGSSTSGSSGNVTNNVGGITVNIQDATPESARKFAEYVQEYLNNQTLTSNLGSL
jgi:murein DD-endopeptidase MepM/ murein hydrolase activator NlpD